MLAIACALIQTPKVLLLDELSLGAGTGHRRAAAAGRPRARHRAPDRRRAGRSARAPGLDIADGAYVLAHSDLTGSGSAEELRNDTDCLVASYLGETPAVAVGRSRKAVQESFRSIHGLVRECDTPRMTNAHPVRVQLTGDREG